MDPSSARLNIVMRIEWLDIAKGLSVLLVVIGHSYLLGSVSSDKFNASLGIFRMPFFFFVSGLFFSVQQGFLNYAIYKFDVLVKPFICVILFGAVYQLIFTDSSSLLYQVKMQLYGTGHSIGWPWLPMWFLPHLWLVFVFSYLFIKATKFQQQNSGYKVILLLILIVFGCVLINDFWYIDVELFGIQATLPGLPFSLDLVLVTSFYFILGYTLKRFVFGFSINIFLFLLSFYLVMAAVFHAGGLIDLNERTIHNPIVSIPASLSGIYCALTLSKLIELTVFFKKIFLVMGQYSLFILIFHFPILDFMKRNGLRQKSMPDVSFEIFFVFLAIFISILIGKVVTKNNFLSLFFKPLRFNKIIVNRNIAR